MSIYDADGDFKGDPAVTMEPLTPARRREMTRRHLLDAAAVVFARDGFHGASLDDVAATAGFTKGAVYSNFKSKEDLFLALFDDHLVREMEGVQDALDIEHSDGRVEQLPRVQSVLERQWSDEWSALYLEFVLYAKRNPSARKKLAARLHQEFEVTCRMLDDVYSGIGATPRWPVPMLARISMSLFEGLGLGRLIDPDAYSQETMNEMLMFLYDTIGVDAPPDGQQS